MRQGFFLISLIVLTACSGGRSDPPRNLDNACAIKADNPRWLRDLAKVERRYGIPAEVILATIYHESGFNARARTPMQYKLGVIPTGRRSTAYGYPQALDGTWDWYKKETLNLRAKRHRFGDAVDFMGWYMDISHKRNGIAKTDAYNNYLAYHQGHTGYKRGSYKSKRWLLGVASKVSARAKRYGAQLEICWR